MAAREAGDEADLEAICGQVVILLVSTFDFPEAEARHRMTLWKSQQQHDLASELGFTVDPTD